MDKTVYFFILFFYGDLFIKKIKTKQNTRDYKAHTHANLYSCRAGPVQVHQCLKLKGPKSLEKMENKIK